MTYQELYSKATTWTARHIAQDHMLTFGRNAQAAPLDIAQVNDWQIKEAGERIPAPQVFPTEGPRSLQYVAYDPETMDVCSDAECHCCAARGNVRGYGETASKALKSFWEAINE